MNEETKEPVIIGLGGLIGSGKTTVSSNSGGTSLRPQERPVLFSKCDYDKAANKVTFRPKSSRDRDAAKAQCMASLGF